MQRFTDLYLDLDATNRSSEKRSILKDYFKEAPPPDAAHALALMTGTRPKRAVKRPTLVAAVLEAADIPRWLLAECHETVGDFSETISLLIPSGPGTRTALHTLIEDRITPLATMRESQQIEKLKEIWSELSQPQILVFHKLLGGGFRVGAQKRLVSRALAEAFDIDPAIVEQRLAGGFKPTINEYQRVTAPESEEDAASRPYPFFLAHQLDTEPKALGEVQDWIAEDKWDGIRVQLIKRSNQTLLWSRGDSRINDQFPELVAAARSLPEGVVIDAEALVMRSGKPRPFTEVQARLNRKVAPTAQPGLFEQDEAVLIAFDLLENNSQDMRPASNIERRDALEQLLSRAAHPAIRLNPRIDASSWDELETIRATARSRGSEGLMLKHTLSPYGSGRRKLTSSDLPHATGWWKWKLDPYTVDCVLVHAQPGSGKRGGLFTDYTFAVWSAHEQDEDRELVTFAKAYSGLTQEEIEKVDRFVRANTVKRMGPVRAVKPELVFELGFEGIARSDRHRSGIAVRFPRMLRWRTDKQPQDADSIELLERFLAEREHIS